jgi:hypothetical protein
MLEAKSLLAKEGNSLVYTFADKTTIKQFRKAWERNEDGCLDKVMKELSSNAKLLDGGLAQEEPAELNTADEQSQDNI